MSHCVMNFWVGPGRRGGPGACGLRGPLGLVGIPTHRGHAEGPPPPALQVEVAPGSCPGWQCPDLADGSAALPETTTHCSVGASLPNTWAMWGLGLLPCAKPGPLSAGPGSPGIW